MEASTLRPAATLPKPRLAIGAPLLRLRSDEQLVALFRAGHDEAFRAIHDRYNRRLFAYARQMLPGRQDAEDVLQDVFVKAYAGLRASDRDLALRAWLFRVAHNRCVDQLRSRPAVPPPTELFQLIRPHVHDPLAEIDLRESLRRLIDDIRRLPDQQRSALLMRELGGMTYAELASSLGISAGAVKSLLVRARLSLAQASEARETACSVIHAHLIEAHDRGIRPNANARRHMRDCSCCKSFRRELRGVSRQLAAFTPAMGPIGFLANLLGFSGGGGAAGGAGLLGGGSTATAGGLAVSTSHVATLLVAAAATAGGAVELQRTILTTVHPPAPVVSHAPKRSGHHALVLKAGPAAPLPAVSGPAPALPASVPTSVPAVDTAHVKALATRPDRDSLRVVHPKRAPATKLSSATTTATTTETSVGSSCAMTATAATVATTAPATTAGASTTTVQPAGQSTGTAPTATAPAAGTSSCSSAAAPAGGSSTAATGTAGGTAPGASGSSSTTTTSPSSGGGSSPTGTGSTGSSSSTTSQ